MRILIIHNQAHFFGGAETMLGYFLQGWRSDRVELAVAAVPQTRFAALIPEHVTQFALADNADLTLGKLLQQTGQLARIRRQYRFDGLHAWAVKDWDLAAMAGPWLRVPAMATLHDHPQAAFLSRSRQRLLRWSARWPLRRVACVSAALSQACAAAGFPPHKLVVVHNGLPDLGPVPTPRSPEVIRFGFLGVFSERKGLRTLFQMMAALAPKTNRGWELLLAGEAQDPAGQRMIDEIRQEYHQAVWWPRVQWQGWLGQIREFLASLDLLICPSSEFDPFPTVLLEAGRMGVPVLAARVGGVPEIVEPGQTGWIFEPRDAVGAANCLAQILEDRAGLQRAGQRALATMRRKFSIGNMVAEYARLYLSL